MHHAMPVVIAFSYSISTLFALCVLCLGIASLHFVQSSVDSHGERLQLKVDRHPILKLRLVPDISHQHTTMHDIINKRYKPGKTLVIPKLFLVDYVRELSDQFDIKAVEEEAVSCGTSR
jgi:hypothetical protein